MSYPYQGVIKSTIFISMLTYFSLNFINSYGSMSALIFDTATPGHMASNVHMIGALIDHKFGCHKYVALFVHVNSDGCEDLHKLSHGLNHNKLEPFVLQAVGSEGMRPLQSRALLLHIYRRDVSTL